jgi:hypothetical protein
MNNERSTQSNFDRLMKQQLSEKQADSRYMLWHRSNIEMPYLHTPDRTVYWIGVIDLESKAWTTKFGELSFYEFNKANLVQDKYVDRNDANKSKAVSYDLTAIIDRLDDHYQKQYRVDHYLLKETVWHTGQQIVEIIRHPSIEPSYPSAKICLDKDGEKWALSLMEAILVRQGECERTIILNNGAYTFVDNVEQKVSAA